MTNYIKHIQHVIEIHAMKHQGKCDIVWGWIIIEAGVIKHLSKA